MADERSVIAYDLYQKAAQQFDYAVTGATGAMCTYILQTFKPKRVEFSPYTLELLALLVLIASVILGFRLIETKVTLLSANMEWLHTNERLGSYVADFHQFPGVNRLSGEVMTPERVAQEIPLLQEKAKAIKAVLDRRGNTCLRLYKWRNRCLLSGVLLLVLARLSAPYWQK
jgi:hypothetical protein